MTRAVTYLRFELRRTFRNRRFLGFSIAFPIIFYYLVAGPNRNEHDFGGTGIDAPLYYMAGLAAFGVMSAMLSAGARIAAERTLGWNRQLRITPLRPSTYLGVKVVTGFVTSLLTLAVLFAAGTTLGVRLAPTEWLEMIGLMLVALVPFAAMGVFLGHVATADSIGPLIGFGTGILAFLGGTWFPITGGGLFEEIARAVPSYWLVQASHVGLGGAAWSREAALVLPTWTLVFALLAVRAYRRDTGKR